MSDNSFDIVEIRNNIAIITTVINAKTIICINKMNSAIDIMPKT